MKIVFRILPAAGVALGLVLGAIGGPAFAQQQQDILKPTPSAVAAAKEFLAVKNARVMYADAVVGVVERTKAALMQTNINYQKDLNEVAVIIAKNFAGRENEIGEAMAQIYARLFTEQELKDLTAFYKSPLGQKLLTTEPRAFQASVAFMKDWSSEFGGVINEQFRAEMHKRGKDI
jgi:uncharacterized protein